jgi:mRNA-degrading endonuclease RelE of RelBE toxin-antitoxin system
LKTYELEFHELALKEWKKLDESIKTHLQKALVSANLLLVERQSRNLIYRPNAEIVQKLSGFLLENCCGGKSCIPSKPIKKVKVK